MADIHSSWESHFSNNNIITRGLDNKISFSSSFIILAHQGYNNIITRGLDNKISFSTSFIILAHQGYDFWHSTAHQIYHWCSTLSCRHITKNWKSKILRGMRNLKWSQQKDSRLKVVFWAKNRRKDYWSSQEDSKQTHK